MNPIACLYDEIKSAIKNKVAEIKYVGLYNNQYEFEEKENAFQKPAVLIQFTDIPWEQKQIGLQQSNMTITLHIAFQSYKDNDLRYFDIIYKIFKAVNNLTTKQTTPLIRSLEQQDTNHDYLLVWKQSYTCLIQDDGTHINNTSIKKEGPFSLELDMNLEIDNPGIRSGVF